MSEREELPFKGPILSLASPHLEEIACRLAGLQGLSEHDRQVIYRSISRDLIGRLHQLLCRVLALELNAARISNRLEGLSSESRWDYFLQMASTASFWSAISEHYPTLVDRTETLIRNKCRAALSFAKRWCDDRQQRADAFGGSEGEMLDVRFGVGDSHCNGNTVSIVYCKDRSVVYKPRSLSTDVKLRKFLNELRVQFDFTSTIAIPDVLDCNIYETV